MPDVDGMQVVEKLRDEKIDLPPNVMFISIGNREIKSETDALGVKKFIYKPIKSDRLARSILGIFEDKLEVVV